MSRKVKHPQKRPTTQHSPAPACKPSPAVSFPLSTLKNNSRERGREVAIGPRARKLPAPYLDACKRPAEIRFL